MGSLVNGTTPAMQCPTPVPAMKATSNGVFGGESPLDFALPLVIIQICLVVVVTRFLAFLIRPMRQPRVVAEIVGGILLGPSALGRITAYKNSVFPARGMTVLDTIANLGLLLFLFLVGLEIDLQSLRRTGKKAISIAAAGMILPFVMGIVTAFVFPEASQSGGNSKVVAFIIFMGVALSITAFGVLARIMAELKLLTTDIGRISMSAAAINDVSAWVLLALAVSLSGDQNSPLVPLWVFISGIAFVIACFVIAPRVFNFISTRCPEGEPIDQKYVCFALCVVLLAGFATDAIGIHAIFGAFVIGVLFPKGHFADAIVEKIEDLVMGLLLPLYFVMSGLKTDITTIHGLNSWGRLALVIITACFGKIVGTVSVSLLCKVGFRDSLVLGVLMNTKGLVELIVLNIGKDRKVLSDQTFAIMVLMAIFTTFITTPIVLTLYKPDGRTSQTQKSDRKRKRKLERDNEEENDIDKTQQVKVMVCLQSRKDINPMMKLIEASRGEIKLDSSSEKFCVYVMHLTQLSERPSSIRMVHKARRNGLPFCNKGIDQFVVAFEAFGKLRSVSVRSVTAISPLSTIHEDICNSADRKGVALVILPFQKQWKSLEKEFETVRSEFQGINKRVLENSLCSVGVLVNRCDNDLSPVASSSFLFTVNVIFFGGSDDREALAYGLRMAEHPGVSLSVVVISMIGSSSDSESEISRFEMLEAQEASSPLLLDEQYLAGIKRRGIVSRFEERIVSSGEEAVEIIRENCVCDLVLVGKSPEGAVVSGLPVVKDECSELGLIGNLIVSNEISNSVSVLVIQQYNVKEASAVGSDGVAVAETP